jgi:hypothetical protein
LAIALAFAFTFAFVFVISFTLTATAAGGGFRRRSVAEVGAGVGVGVGVVAGVDTDLTLALTPAPAPAPAPEGEVAVAGESIAGAVIMSKIPIFLVFLLNWLLRVVAFDAALDAAGVAAFDDVLAPPRSLLCTSAWCPILLPLSGGAPTVAHICVCNCPMCLSRPAAVLLVEVVVMVVVVIAGNWSVSLVLMAAPV